MLNLFGKSFGRAIAAVVFGFSLLAVPPSARAQSTPRDYAVEVTASIMTAPPQVHLQWPADVNASSYAVSRKLPSATTWTSLTTLAGSASGYTDGNVTVGSSFEYRVVKTFSGGTQVYGYIVAGVDAPLVENRGKLILVVADPDATADRKSTRL